MDEQTKERAITGWLAQAHPVPRQAHAEWDNDGVALLPLGPHFSAVRIPASRIHAAVSSTDLKVITEVLAEWLDGPVIHGAHGTSGAYHALVPNEADLDWDIPYAPLLGPGTYLGVPRLDRQRPPGVHWVVRPRYEGHLCASSYVRALLAVAEAAEAGAGQ